MAKILCAAGIIVVACACRGTRGATWYVNKSALKGGDGTSWEKALRMMQKGMHKAVNGLRRRSSKPKAVPAAGPILTWRHHPASSIGSV